MCLLGDLPHFVMLVYIQKEVIARESVFVPEGIVGYSSSSDLL